MLRDTDIHSDPDLAFSSLEGHEYVCTRQDLFLLCLLHVEYLWNNNLLSLGFNSLGAIARPVKALADKKLISIHPMKRDTKNVIYTLTRDGYDRLQMLLPDTILESLGKGFIDRNSLPKQISHILNCNDFFIASLSAPSRPRVQWFRAKDSIDARDEERSEIRNDARAIINEREFWIEQDMGTENMKALKVKFTRIASQLQKRESPPALIFTISLNSRISNIEKGVIYTPILPDRQKRDILADTKKNMKQHFYDTVPEYIANLKANVTRATSHHEKYGYQKRLDYLEEIVAGGATTYTDLCNLLKEKEQGLKDKRFSILETKIASMTGSRIRAVKASCIEAGEEGRSRIHTAMLAGADVYIMRNEDLIDLLHGDLYAEENHMTLVARQLHAIIDAEEDSHLIRKEFKERHTYQTSSEKDFTLRNNIIYTHPTEGEILRCAVEDMTYNYGAELRIRNALDSANALVPLTLVCIVDSFETARDLSAQYRLERFNTDDNSFFKCHFIDKETLRSGGSIYSIVNGQKKIG